MSEFGFESTTDDVLKGKDLTGQTVFITGGNSGLGLETGRAMAAAGAHIVLAGRDQAKLEEAARTIRNATGSGTVDTIICDLASFDSVRACAGEANERFGRIDLLINNAGIMGCPQGTTADGFERQFGTNHLGHFLLTKHLMPLLDRGTGKRIVNLSSLVHHRSPVNFDDPNFENREYDPWESYAQSKTANALFSVALHQRVKDLGFDVFAVHPGGVMTNLIRHATMDDLVSLQKSFEEDASTTGEQAIQMKTVEQGAATTCWAATADAITGQGGSYCEDCHIAEVDDNSMTSGVRSYAINPEDAERLWSLSEALIGESFTL